MTAKKLQFKTKNGGVRLAGVIEKEKSQEKKKKGGQVDRVAEGNIDKTKSGGGRTFTRRGRKPVHSIL